MIAMTRFFCPFLFLRPSDFLPCFRRASALLAFVTTMAFVAWTQSETTYFEDWVKSDGTQLTQVQNEFLENVAPVNVQHAVRISNEILVKAMSQVVCVLLFGAARKQAIQVLPVNRTLDFAAAQKSRDIRDRNDTHETAKTVCIEFSRQSNGGLDAAILGAVNTGDDGEHGPVPLAPDLGHRDSDGLAVVVSGEYPGVDGQASIQSTPGIKAK